LWFNLRQELSTRFPWPKKKKKPEYRHQMVVLEKDEVLRLHDDSAKVAYNNSLEASKMCEINA
jgi:hypothetical protein